MSATTLPGPDRPEDHVPTYQYACTDCGHRFEQVQAFTDDSLTVCPVCGGKLRKVYGSVGVVFKGSGFYRTDSRSGQMDAAKPSEAKKSDGKKEGSGDGTAKSGAASTSASSGGGSAGSASYTSNGSSSGAKAGAGSSTGKAS